MIESIGADLKSPRDRGKVKLAAESQRRRVESTVKSTARVSA